VFEKDNPYDIIGTSIVIVIYFQTS